MIRMRAQITYQKEAKFPMGNPPQRWGCPNHRWETQIHDGKPTSAVGVPKSLMGGFKWFKIRILNSCNTWFPIGNSKKFHSSFCGTRRTSLVQKHRVVTVPAQFSRKIRCFEGVVLLFFCERFVFDITICDLSAA